MAGGARTPWLTEFGDVALFVKGISAVTLAFSVAGSDDIEAQCAELGLLRDTATDPYRLVVSAHGARLVIFEPLMGAGEVLSF